MSVTLTPYDYLLYGANPYGGIQITAVPRFDGPQDRAATIVGTPQAATFDFNQPGRI